MQKHSDEFLITQILSLIEVGIWTILSYYHDVGEIIENEFILKTFAFEDPDELLIVFQHLADYEIITREELGQDSYVLKLSRALFIY